MSRTEAMNSPKKLGDFSHLFFSNVEEPSEEPPAGPAPSPQAKSTGISSGRSSATDPLEAVALKRLLKVNVASLFEGARLVDAEALEPEGVDLILKDGGGRPVFLEVLREDARLIPYRIFSVLDWLRGKSGLFLKAYYTSGILEVDDPLFLFVASHFSADAVRAAGAMASVRLGLLEARPLRVDDTGGVLLQEVFPIRNGAGRSLFLAPPT